MTAQKTRVATPLPYCLSTLSWRSLPSERTKKRDSGMHDALPNFPSPLARLYRWFPYSSLLQTQFCLFFPFRFQTCDAVASSNFTCCTNLFPAPDDTSMSCQCFSSSRPLYQTHQCSSSLLLVAKVVCDLLLKRWHLFSSTNSTKLAKTLLEKVLTQKIAMLVLKIRCFSKVLTINAQSSKWRNRVSRSAFLSLYATLDTAYAPIS